MKASEFVKKFGWGEAKSFLSFDSDVEIVYTAPFFDDLKRLVESYELVEFYGGLEKSREYLGEKFVFEWTALDGKLSQAICDVESYL